MEIATIGFTRTTAQGFFERLTAARVVRVLDVRLRNTSQLDGFAKRPDLEFLLEKLCAAKYEHDLRLAPTAELLGAYRRNKDWSAYEREYRQLMIVRELPATLDRGTFEEMTALLCSEDSAEHCHRRLVAEMLADAWGASVEHP